jgi:DNA primase
LSREDNVAKYLNSPATIIFDKSKELYGFNFAKNNIRKQKYIIITEGQFDIVLSHQNNFLNTVATSGTSLTEEHLKKIKNFTSNIIL